MNKAQQGLSAAILVAIISGLIILYILFLPADEKKALLGEENNSRGSTVKGKTTVIFSKSVGEILVPAKKVDDRLLPNIFLAEVSNAKILERINPFSIRNGWGDKKNKVISFKIDSVENTDNAILSFSAPKRKGTLTIKLNNEVVYESSSAKPNIIVDLKKGILKEDNTLEFSVSSVGYRFWTTNEYSFEDIKIIGDVADTSRQESQNVIELSESEFANLDRAVLKFIPFCKNVAELGILDVMVNERKVYSAVPVCDDRTQIPVLSALNEGQNTIVFRTSSGRYSIEQIKVALELKEARVLTYYFELSTEQMKDIVNNKKSANMTMNFVDDDKNKRAEISLNGHLIRVDQSKPVFNEIVTEKVNDGNNYLEIRPKSTLKVVDVKVVLADK